MHCSIYHLPFCFDLACRPDGLFPPGDALLAELGAQARTHAFEKHLAGRRAPAELLPRGSWASGNAAARAGLDLRLFYQVAAVSSLHTGACESLHVCHGWVVCTPNARFPAICTSPKQLALHAAVVMRPSPSLCSDTCRWPDKSKTQASDVPQEAVAREKQSVVGERMVKASDISRLNRFLEKGKLCLCAASQGTRSCGSSHLCLLLQECQPGKEWGLVAGAARLGEGASIGNGFWMTAHGGAVRSPTSSDL